MQRLNLAQLKERIDKGKPTPALLLLGDEPYLRDAGRALLIQKFVPEAARTWALSRFSADRGEVQNALDQCQSLPMLSSRQVVFLEDAEAIEKFGEKVREASVESLTAYLQDPAPFTVFVIEAASLDMRMVLAKKLVDLTTVVDVSLGERAEDRIAAAEALANTLAKEQGISFEKGAAEDLAEFVNGDLMRLKMELDKLSTFAAHTKAIRRHDVATLVVSEKSSTIWEVAELLAAHQPRKALEFIYCLLREGEEPVLMVGGMAWMYRKLVEASEVRGVTNGWQAARALSMRPEQAELAIRCARNIPRERLLDGLCALREADDRLKGGAKDVRAVMEFLVWRLSGDHATASK
ncbi:MAG: DNA polymerase III subunit delta [Candidatus Acidiferrum sp.]